jgi:hypothetical protein
MMGTPLGGRGDSTSIADVASLVIGGEDASDRVRFGGIARVAGVVSGFNCVIDLNSAVAIGARSSRRAIVSAVGSPISAASRLSMIVIGSDQTRVLELPAG